MMFTVGMALYSDHRCPTEEVRARFTVMSLLTGHPLVGEVIVVDNHPQAFDLGDGRVAYRTSLAQLEAKTNGKVRYVPMPRPVGTAAPRNRVFEEAKFDHVACLDSHVLLYPGCLEALREFYLSHGSNSPDLLHGPMMTEAGVVMATHMNDQWRAEMWGTWAVAWWYRNFLFSVMTLDDKSLLYVSLDSPGEQRVLQPEQIGLPPNLSWSGHEKKLEEAGCRRYMEHPFCIPGHGLGFFACRKDAWLGGGHFHLEARGFGGEEMTTGYRFRKLGRQVWCVPGAKWWHDFSRHEGTNRLPYRLSGWDKARNYALELKRLGLPLDPVYDEFVATHKIPEVEWEMILAGARWPYPAEGITKFGEGFGRVTGSRPAELEPDPPDVVARVGEIVQRHAQNLLRGREAATANRGSNVGDVMSSQKPITNVEELYVAVCEKKQELAPALALVRDLAERGGEGEAPARVVEIFTGSADVTTAILAGHPKELTTYDVRVQSGRPAILKAILPNGTIYQNKLCNPDTVEVPECDVLVINGFGMDESVVLKVKDRNDLWLRATRFVAVVGYEGALSVQGKHGLTFKPRRQPVQAPAAPVKQEEQPKPQRIEIPNEGPGIELRTLLQEHKVQMKASCDCNSKIAQMNLWGVKGCRENFNTIVGWMKDGAEKYGWADWLKAAAMSMFTGLAFKVDPTDPWPGIIREAIRRAEEKGLK